MLRCTGCQVLFTFPVIINQDLGFLYVGNYFTVGNKLSPLERLYRYDQYRYDLSLYRNWLKTSHRVLDYGCGDGSRVAYFQKEGFTLAEGIDKYMQISGTQVAGTMAVRTESGQDRDPLSYIPAAQYDCVTMYHVLEHFQDPNQHIAHVASNLLAPGGIVCIQVPNSDCWQFKKQLANWIPLDVPRHFWHFNRHSLIALLQTHGFEILRVAATNSIFHPTSILSSVFGFDVRAQWQTGRRKGLSLQAQFLLYHLLALPWALYENIRQQSSLLNVIARKPI